MLIMQALGWLLFGRSQFIFSLSIPYMATVLHVFMHSHDHSHETHNSYFEGVHQAEEECSFCYLLTNPLNNFIFPFISTPIYFTILAQ